MPANRKSGKNFLTAGRTKQNLFLSGGIMVVNVLLQRGMNIIIGFTVRGRTFPPERHIVGPKIIFFTHRTVNFKHETSPREKLASLPPAFLIKYRQRVS
jgi:hypothetical protein